MRTSTVFENVDASQSHVSEVYDFDKQDARFMIQATKTGTNGNPIIIVEEAISNVWTALENTSTWNEYTEIDNTESVAIKDSYFMGKFMRIRLEPNGTTTGTVNMELGYKTKV